MTSQMTTRSLFVVAAMLSISATSAAAPTTAITNLDGLKVGFYSANISTNFAEAIPVDTPVQKLLFAKDATESAQKHEQFLRDQSVYLDNINSGVAVSNEIAALKAKTSQMSASELLETRAKLADLDASRLEYFGNAAQIRFNRLRDYDFQIEYVPFIGSVDQFQFVFGTQEQILKAKIVVDRDKPFKRLSVYRNSKLGPTQIFVSVAELGKSPRAFFVADCSTKLVYDTIDIASKQFKVGSPVRRLNCQLPNAQGEVVFEVIE